MIKNSVIILIALLAPVIITGASVWVIAHPWFIAYEYKRIDFPKDINLEDRTNLALNGLYSILPGTEGIALLKRAQLHGRPAFNEREVQHMIDVRNLMHILFVSALWCVLFMILLLLVSRSRSLGLLMIQGLKIGSLVTLSIIVGALGAILFNFESFFLKFHTLFFEGDSFLFDHEDTLMRLYPEQFWHDGALLAVILTALSAIILFFITRSLVRRYATA